MRILLFLLLLMPPTIGAAYGGAYRYRKDQGFDPESIVSSAIFGGMVGFAVDLGLAGLWLLSGVLH